MVSPAICKPISYSILVSGMDSVPFLSFEPEERKMSIYTEDNSVIGTYQVIVYGKLKFVTVKSAFYLTISNPCLSTTIIPSNISDISFTIGSPAMKV